MALVPDLYSILYANDLPDCVSDLNQVVHLFADDTKISSPLSDVAQRQTLQEQLNAFTLCSNT